MALILTRSPFFVSNQGFDEGASLTLEVGYQQYSPPISIEFVVEKSYVLNFRKQTEIDVSPLIRSELVSNNIRRVRITINGFIGGVAQSPVTNEYVATDGYLFYTDGYNTDKEQDLIDNNFYTGSSDVVYKLDDEPISIFLFCSSDDGYKADVYFKYKGEVVESYSLIDFGDVGFGAFNAEDRQVEVSSYPYSNFISDALDNGFTVEDSINLDRFYKKTLINSVDSIVIDRRLGSGDVENTKTIKVITIEEDRYSPIKVEFRNRWGCNEQFYFFKRSDKTINTTRDKYRSSTIDTFKTGDLSKHIYKDYNVNARESIVMNTGWIPEEFYNNISQMMMSEFVWMYVDGEKLPINVKSSNLTEKLHVNEKLINYEIEIEFSFDKIGSVI